MIIFQSLNLHTKTHPTSSLCMLHWPISQALPLWDTYIEPVQGSLGNRLYVAPLWPTTE